MAHSKRGLKRRRGKYAVRFYVALIEGQKSLERTAFIHKTNAQGIKGVRVDFVLNLLTIDLD